jgi:very-short-patch-repair endonuclease
MHKDVPAKTRRFAKALRVNATDAERRLWSILRAGRLNGLKFKRQVPLDGYIVDFVCYDAKLIIEADGSQHSESPRDMVRDAHFAAAGYRTLRFWNNDILTNPDGVARMIAETAQAAPVLTTRSP